MNRSRKRALRSPQIDEIMLGGTTGAGNPALTDPSPTPLTCGLKHSQTCRAKSEAPHIAARVNQLRGLLASIDQLDQAISTALDAHPKTHLLSTLPRVGRINLAQLIAEIGPILDRAVNAERACTEAGAAPVTRASGKHAGVNFRWAVNTRARQALTTWADNSRHGSPWAAQLYAKARARGKRHPHAIRIIARAWLRVVWACWTTNTTYDPTLHGAERRLNHEIAA
jgi:transposase